MSKKSDKFLTRRRALQLLGGGVVAATGAAGYAFGVEPDRLVVREVDLEIDELPDSFVGKKIAQLTDIHFEKEEDMQLMESVVKRVNALEPDIILYTGDFITSDMLSFEDLASYLDAMVPRMASVGIMGNHDVWHGDFHRMKKRFERGGMSFFRNDHMKLHEKGEHLFLNGLDSVWGGIPDVNRSFKGISDTAPCLTLMHEPDFFDTIAELGKNMVQFSGHTHGGQCRVPLIGYAPVKVKYGKKYILGHYQNERKQQLYVSSGVGTVSLRVRFACPPEIVLFTLKRRV